MAVHSGGKHEGGYGSLPAHKSGYGDEGQLPFEKGGKSGGGGGGGGSDSGSKSMGHNVPAYPKNQDY